MDVIVSETNKKKKCLIYDGFTFRVDRILKNNDISWRCTNNKSKCKARVRTDGESKVVMSAMSKHNHDMNERKIESKQLRVMAKQKASDDISARPSKIIRQELQKLDESNLQTNCPTIFLSRSQYELSRMFSVFSFVKFVSCMDNHRVQCHIRGRR